MTKADDDKTEEAEIPLLDDVRPLPMWMRSVPEIPTPEEIEEKKAWIAALYPDDLIQEIIQKSRFTGESDAADTKDFLVKAGYWYFDHRDLRHPAASFSVDRAQLEAIATAASELAAKLRDLNDVAAETLWHPFHNSSQFTSPWIAHGHKTEFGLTIKKYTQPDGSIAVHHLKPWDIEEALTVLHHLATAAANSFPVQKGGQPQDQHRQAWIINAMYFWRTHSSLAFDPRSAAFDFCHIGFKTLNPNVSPEQIKSAMRAAAKSGLISSAKPLSTPVQEP